MIDPNCFHMNKIVELLVQFCHARNVHVSWHGACSLPEWLLALSRNQRPPRGLADGKPDEHPMALAAVGEARGGPVPASRSTESVAAVPGPARIARSRLRVGPICVCFQLTSALSGR